MIDTDKYEGHNMHPALLDVGEDYNNWDALQDMGFNDEARQLIAAAPLLLEEVKRLREDNKKLHDAINGCAYRGSEGSALDLYCESIIERCPTCYQNIDDMECGCE